MMGRSVHKAQLCSPLQRSRRHFEALDSAERGKLRDTILAGLPMSSAFTVDAWREAVAAYKDLTDDDVRDRPRPL